MEQKEIIDQALTIIELANTMRMKHAPDFSGHVGYCCFFCQNENEFVQIDKQVRLFGTVAKDTPTGPVFLIPPVSTSAGPLRVLKIRKPDPTRTELGDADFSIDKYEEFKNSNQGKAGFSLITREEFEMIELMDADFNVRAYFSNPPVDKQKYVVTAIRNSTK